MKTAETLEAINQTAIETPPQTHAQESPTPASDPFTVAEQTEAAVWESLMEIRYAGWSPSRHRNVGAIQAQRHNGGKTSYE